MMRTRLAAVTVAVVTLVTVAVGCGATKHPTSSPPSTVPGSTGGTGSEGSSAGEGAPPPVPSTGAYLGAWVNPEKSAGSGDTDSRELEQLPTFKAATGSAPAILSVYTPWTSPAPTATLEGIASQGAIPLVAWGCASTAAINSGQYDQLITNYADSLRTFGHPVLLRWFWEMNLSVAKEAACIGSGGPSGFVTAWRRVWTIFHQARATNVSFVWCPGITGGLTGMAGFFPGANYVDWIGVDGYDRQRNGQRSFADIFGAWYSAYVGYNKPMMIGETGAMANGQVSYLQGIESSLPTQFPKIKALVYFDARGPAGPWQLTGDGLQAFHQLAANPYFSVRA